MLYVVPDYYKEFHCLAGKCEDTCCAGWQIVVDEKSLDRYRKEKGLFGIRLRNSIYWGSSTFKQSRDKRCAFLNRDNLCDMQLNLGEESLCKTCRRYPRHMEEFENIREISLSVSCPEAARILLEKKEPVTYFSYEKEGCEEYEDYDPFLYSKLAEGREVMREILQNRELSLEVRMELALGLAHDMQVRVNRGNLFACDELFEKCRKAETVGFVLRKLEKNRIYRTKRYAYSKKLFRNLYRLELLHEEWDYQLGEADYLLYGHGNWGYEKLHEEFSEWLEIHMPEWKIQCEQLLVYFIYTYFCGAVYDGRVYAKAQMAVVCVWLIYEMLAAKWRKNEGILDLQDIVMTVYLFSRELEHSDENLELMEKMMEETVILSGF